MRHLVHTAKLNRNCGHRKAMLVNLACSLIEHESIQTTTIRAKELRRFVERDPAVWLTRGTRFLSRERKLCKESYPAMLVGLAIFVVSAS